MLGVVGGPHRVAAGTELLHKVIFEIGCAHEQIMGDERVSLGIVAKIYGWNARFKVCARAIDMVIREAGDGRSGVDACTHTMNRLAHSVVTREPRERERIGLVEGDDCVVSGCRWLRLIGRRK